MIGPPDLIAANLLSSVPGELVQELTEVLLESEGTRIERILSHGHQSPESGWYNQDEHEWVLVLQGGGRIEFKEGRVVLLRPGDHVNIPAGCQHRVIWTDPDEVTIWLAVFYR